MTAYATYKKLVCINGRLFYYPFWRMEKLWEESTGAYRELLVDVYIESQENCHDVRTCPKLGFDDVLKKWGEKSLKSLLEMPKIKKSFEANPGKVLPSRGLLRGAELWDQFPMPSIEHNCLIAEVVSSKDLS